MKANKWLKEGKLAQENTTNLFFYQKQLFFVTNLSLSVVWHQSLNFQVIVISFKIDSTRQVPASEQLSLNRTPQRFSPSE